MAINTLNELLDLASQGKLDEIDTLAAEVQGWRKIGNEGDSDWATPNKEGCETVVRHYHPTRDKAQAWDLMVKGELSVYINNFKINGIKINTAEIGGGIDIDYKDPLIAVTIAFILAMQGEE